jgi:tungstate transport system permease protein
MSYIWHLLQQSWPGIADRNGFVREAFWNSIRVAVYSTVAALILGLPIALAIGVGRFRGRRVLQAFANASLGLPSVVVGVVVLEVLRWPLAGWHWAFTMTAIYIAQTILALPYIVALIPAAIQELTPELQAQARLLGAGRLQISALVLRESQVGVLAAVIAALGAGLSEVGAVLIVGGGGSNVTLGALIVPALGEGPYGYPTALACGQVLLGLVLLLLGILTLVQQRSRRGRRACPVRFSTATA